MCVCCLLVRLSLRSTIFRNQYLRNKKNVAFIVWPKMAKLSYWPKISRVRAAAVSSGFSLLCLQSCYVSSSLDQNYINMTTVELIQVRSDRWRTFFYWKCDCPINPHVLLLVGWSFFQSVCHKFLKWHLAGKLNFHGPIFHIRIAMFHSWTFMGKNHIRRLRFSI